MDQTNEKLRPRPVSDSKSEMIELVLPNDTNPLGALLGGRLMHWIDLAGALAAHRHSHSYAVTASMDHIDFLVPVHVGDMVILQSSVNRAFHTSMEVGVRVLVENYISGVAAESCDRLFNVCGSGPPRAAVAGSAGDSRKRRREAALSRERFGDARLRRPNASAEKWKEERRSEVAESWIWCQRAGLPAQHLSLAGKAVGDSVPLIRIHRVVYGSRRVFRQRMRHPNCDHTV